MMVVEVSVRFTAEIWHCWPYAPEHRRYLVAMHRHLMHIEVAIQVGHENREIEFHDLLDFCHTQFPRGDVGSASCEMLASDLARALQSQYGPRRISVSVFEDGEVGARVTCTR